MENFRQTLECVGVNKGDILYVASDVSRILWDSRKYFALIGNDDLIMFFNGLIEQLQNIVGDQGTLLLPVYNWDFCRGEAFDYRKTQGVVGVLNNFILNNRNDFIRTKHPLYSFMVWGKDAKQLYEMNNQEAWGQASPFAYLHKNGAKHLCLNTTIRRSLTFKHYVEQSVNVPYRHHKYFMGSYIDENGVEEVRVYSQYVRDLSIKYTATQSEEFLLSGGACKLAYFQEWPISLTNLAIAYELFKEDLICNHGANVCQFENYSLPEKWDKNSKYEVGFLKDRLLLS